MPSLIKSSLQVQNDDSPNSFYQASKLPSSFLMSFWVSSISVWTDFRIRLWNTDRVLDSILEINLSFYSIRTAQILVYWQFKKNVYLHKFSKQYFLVGSKNQLDHSRRNLSLSSGLSYRFRITGTTETLMLESYDGLKMWMKYFTLALSVCKMHHLDKLHIWIVLPRCWLYHLRMVSEPSYLLRRNKSPFHK